MHLPAGCQCRASRACARPSDAASSTTQRAQRSVSLIFVHHHDTPSGSRDTEKSAKRPNHNNKETTSENENGETISNKQNQRISFAHLASHHLLHEGLVKRESLLQAELVQEHADCTALKGERERENEEAEPKNPTQRLSQRGFKRPIKRTSLTYSEPRKR